MADEKISEEVLDSEETVEAEAEVVDTAEQATDDVGDDSAAFSAQIDTLTAALATAKDQTLRAQAEEQNARRRAQQDVEKAHKFGLDKFVGDLLPVIDNLDRALSTIDREDDVFKAVIEGLDLTLKSFADTLGKHQVLEVNPEGEPFDPQLHQAMSMVESPDVEPNTVINVFQKGYTLHGRLVRPAMVVVAK